jgi:hypothetical protein
MFCDEGEQDVKSGLAYGRRVAENPSDGTPLSNLT